MTLNSKIKIFSLFLFGFLPNIALAGVIDGNGDEIWDLEPTDPPSYQELNTFLKKLSEAEPTWVSVIRKAFQEDPTVIFLKTEENCFLKEKPDMEVRANYDQSTNIMVFCKTFYDYDSTQRLMTFLHELTHFALHYLKDDQALGAGEEQVVKLIEYWYRKGYEAKTFVEYKDAILKLRPLLDRFAPHLIFYSKKETIVPPYEMIPMFNDPSLKVQFPVPIPYDPSEYIPPHFLDYYLFLIWTKDHAFDQTLIDSLGEPFPKDHEIWTKSVSYFDWETGKVSKRVFTDQWTRFEWFRYYKLIPMKIKSDALTEDFRSFFDATGWDQIRTVNNRIDPCEGFPDLYCIYDVV